MGRETSDASQAWEKQISLIKATGFPKDVKVLQHKMSTSFVLVLQVRCAGCVWLLSLVSYTGKHPKLMPLLSEIQEGFSHLLGDPNELTQEMASRGMSVVYSLGDESARKQLLDGLMGVLQGIENSLFCTPHLYSLNVKAYVDSLVLRHALLLKKISTR